MVTSKFPSLIKPSKKTKFKIDFDWWQKNDRDWRVYLKGFLCLEHQDLFASYTGDEQIDWVDPKTAVVKSVDALQHVLMNHCAKQESFQKSTTALVDSVFRVFLANGNKPLSCDELASILNKSPELILRTFSSHRVYKGIRPVI